VRRFDYHDDLDPIPQSSPQGWRPSSVTITADSWQIIARTRSLFHLLPNLEHLSWIKGDHVSWTTGTRRIGDSQLEHCQLFLHYGLHTFSFALQDFDVDQLRLLLSNVVVRSPRLEVLSVTCDDGVVDAPLEDCFFQSVSQLSELREIRLPGFWLTTITAAAFAGLPKLHSITQQFLTVHGNYADYESILKFRPVLPTRPFGVLHVLDLACSIEDATAFILHRPAPQLTKLVLAVPYGVDDPSKITKFLSELGSALPSLIHLHLDTQNEEEFPDESITVIIDALSPVCALKYLVTFEFHHMSPLEYTFALLTSFLRALPKSMRRLNLNCCPFIVTDDWDLDARNLDVLDVFAACCPDLTHLGLLVNVDLYEDFSWLKPKRTHPFNNPLCLSMGTSRLNISTAPPVGHTRQLSKLLARICPRGCTMWPDFTIQKSASFYDIHPDVYRRANAATWSVMNEEIAQVWIASVLYSS
jgi:hypothetical protein